jgi:hypothetical protein
MSNFLYTGSNLTNIESVKRIQSQVQNKARGLIILALTIGFFSYINDTINQARAHAHAHFIQCPN